MFGTHLDSVLENPSRVNYQSLHKAKANIPTIAMIIETNDVPIVRVDAAPVNGMKEEFPAAGAPLAAGVKGAAPAGEIGALAPGPAAGEPGAEPALAGEVGAALLAGAAPAGAGDSGELKPAGAAPAGGLPPAGELP